MTDAQQRKQALLDALAPIVDGEEAAVQAFADALAADDDLRDLRHEAADITALLSETGADYQPPADMQARVLAAIDAEPAAAPPRLAASQGLGAPAAAPDGPNAPAAPISLARWRARPELRARVFGLTCALAAAAALVMVLRQRPSDGTAPMAKMAAEPDSDSRIVALVGPTPARGFGVRLQQGAAGRARRALPGSTLGAGSVLATDAWTRVRLRLSDGSKLVIDRDSSVRFESLHAHRVHLRRGQLLATVAKRQARARPALYRTRHGEVEVRGTQFQLSTSVSESHVRLLRGSVILRSHSGRQRRLRPGQEGVMDRQGRIELATLAPDAGDLAWTRMAEEQDDKAPLAGLGELSAKRPGAAAEQSESLRLAQHHVEVRVTGHVARTVIEESFANDSEHELEGIFRFPLPPDAELDALALEVDGRWEEGAFVARARARKIWRGVIRQATPRSLRKKKEEFIWVPGPWRDPALLEWQQGGRFELRIFPIPARGVRRVRLSYRQRLPRVGKLRRYRYPLAFASDASTTIGDFRFALHTDAGKTLYAPGYRLTRSKAQGKRTRHSITGRDFLPNGDIHIDLPVRFGARELSWWTYSGPATVAPGDRSRAEDAAVSARQSAWHRDERAYVLFALRPDFPAEPKRIDRDVALVVDTSQSMVGERARRAFRLVEATLQHMDRRDRFTVLACDLHCKAFPGGLQSPSRARTAQVMRFLRQHGIAGASNIARFVRAGQAALQASARDRHVLYIGDGMSSTGARRLPTLRAAARMLRQNGAALHTVAVGGEADLQAMRALAQAGGGAMQRFVPGQHADAAGLSVVQTLAGNRLQAVRVTLPPGLTAVAPATGRLPNLRRGEELLVAARFTGAVRGQLTVSGSLSGRPWQRSYPVDLQPAEQPGNRFVAASWARQQIAAREQDSHPDAVIEAVALSKAFGVLSRHTSLLVLESEAMLRAFGIDRQGERPTWSGEEDVALGGEAGEAHKDVEVAASSGALRALRGGGSAPSDEALADTGGLGLSGIGGSGGGGSSLRTQASGGSGAGYGRGAAASERRPRRRASASSRAPDRDPRERKKPARQTRAAGDEGGPAAFAPPPASSVQAAPALLDAVREAEASDDKAPLEQAAPATKPEAPALEQRPAPRRPPRGRWMRRVWQREARIAPAGRVRARDLTRAEAAVAHLRQNPLSRDRHRDAVRAMSRAGRLAEAEALARQWRQHDPLDPEALTYLADVIGRQGKRAQALRLLSGIVDLDPDMATLQRRLAKALARAGDEETACGFWLALAEREPPTAQSTFGRRAALRLALATYAEDVAAALTCLEKTGLGHLRAGVREHALGGDGGGLAQKLDKARAVRQSESLRGELRLDARWDVPEDLDLSLITPEGTRLSWLGGRTTVRARDVRAKLRESLGLRRITPGSYWLEISRSHNRTKPPALRGHVQAKVLQQSRRLHFHLPAGQNRRLIARIEVRRQARLVPANRPMR